MTSKNRSLQNQLFKGLPKGEKDSLKNCDLDQINQFFHTIPSMPKASFWNEENLPEISRLSIAAFLKNKISLQEMTTIHFLIGAWIEFIYDTLLTTVIFNKKKGITLSFSLTQEQKKLIEESMKEPAAFGSLPFDSLGVLDAQKKPTTEDSIYKETERTYGAIEPVLKKYFHLNKKEWAAFVKQIKKQPLFEQQFYFMQIPVRGGAAPFLDFLKTQLDFFSPQRLYFPTKNSHVTANEILIIPSLSSFQIFFNIKAKSWKTDTYTLIPLFGYTSLEDIHKLKKQGQAPLGLYYGASPYKKSKINAFIKEGDLFPTNAFSFALHDIYHALFDMHYRRSL